MSDDLLPTVLGHRAEGFSLAAQTLGGLSWRSLEQSNEKVHHEINNEVNHYKARKLTNKLD